MEPSPAVAALEKKELRVVMRHRLGSLDKQAQSSASHAILKHLMAEPWAIPLSTVTLFAPVQGEPDLTLWWSCTQRPRLLLPRCENEESLGLYEVPAWGALTQGRFGQWEPSPAVHQRVELDEVDLILVPGLAFDRSGGRLGRGKGFYDRLLAKLPDRVRRLGVCFQAQLVEAVPVESHDQRLHGIVTENGLYNASI